MARVFISYARADDQPTRFDQPRAQLSPIDQGWVTLLEQRLSHCLGPLLPPRFDIDFVRDVNERPEDFDELMVKWVADADALLCVVSNQFVDSDWTLAELTNFSESTPLGTDTVPSRPLFKVVRYPVDPAHEPAELRAIPPTAEFFAVEADGPRDLHPRNGPQDDQLLWQRAAELAREVVRRMRESFSDIKPRGRIYVAETDSALDSLRVRLRRGLQDMGFEVLPARIQSIRTAEIYSEQVAECVAKADLSIHLLGSRRAAIPAGGASSIEAMQIDQVRRATPGKGCLVWLPPGLPAPMSEQAELRRQVLRDPAPFELYDSVIEQVFDAVERSFPRVREVPKPGARQTAGECSIYLHYESAGDDDDALADDIADVLIGAGAQVEYPVVDATPEELEASFARRVQAAGATVIVWAEQSEGWLDSTRARITAAAPECLPAVFLAPPHSRAKKLALRRGRGAAFDALESLPRKALADFVAGLAGEGSG